MGNTGQFSVKQDTVQLISIIEQIDVDHSFEVDLPRLLSPMDSSFLQDKRL